MRESAENPDIPTSSYVAIGGFVLAICVLAALPAAPMPNLHTILNTTIFLISAILALNLWDMGRRLRRPFKTWLAIAFGVAAVTNLLHVLTTVTWLDVSAPESAQTWPLASTLLPLSLLAALALLKRQSRAVTVLAIATLLTGALLYWLYQEIPPYTAPGLVGMTRPSLVPIPLLWACVAVSCWRMRQRDRALKPLTLVAGTLFFANCIILYSRAPHDAAAMMAHVGDAAGSMALLASLVHMSSLDLVERMDAQADLTRMNEALEVRVEQRTRALQQAYDELRRTQDAAIQHERLRALGQMASGIAHDINNSLSPVGLYANLLLRTEAHLSEAGRSRLSVIERAIHEVSQTVSKMTAFYRERSAPLAPVRAAPVIAEVIELSRASWRDIPLESGNVINMVTDLEPDLPDILCAENELHDALVNLILNAVDALPAGGTITISGRRNKATDPSKPPVVELVVEDNGVGMDEETRQRCLDPFFTTKGEHGSGLGLAMVYGTTRRQGGDIIIDSAPGKGTRVRMILPASTEPGAPRASNDATVPEGLHLLLVDDDPVVLQSLEDALRSDGHTVAVSGGGAQGISAFIAALATGSAFDAVITDLGMPQVDGRRVAAAIKEAAPSTPVILLTGWGVRLAAEGDTPPGIDCILSKPPKIQEIRLALARHAKSGSTKARTASA